MDFPVTQTLGEFPLATDVAADRARKIATRTFMAAVIAHVLADLFGQSVWPVYKTLAGLDVAVAGVILTAASMMGTIMQPLFGLLADRIGRRFFILLGTALAMMTALLGPLTGWRPAIDQAGFSAFGIAGSYWVMFALLLAGRFGQDMFHPAGAGLAGSYSKTRGTMVLAIFIAFGSVGYGLSQVVFKRCYVVFDGHTEILLIPGVILWVLVWKWCRPAAIDESKVKSVGASLAALRPIAGPVIVLFLILALSAGVNMGLFFLMPEFAKQRGYPKEMGEGWAFGLIILGATLVMIPAGHLADRIGRKRTLMAAMVLSAISYHAIVGLPTMPVWAFAALCVVGGAFLGVVNPLGVSFGQRLAPENIGIVSAVLMGLAWCLGSVSPSIVGFLAKHTDAHSALLWVGSANVVMVALGLLLPGSKAVTSPGRT
jgi:FSR family fosmidomycin resistance protein-like MFS transporter